MPTHTVFLSSTFADFARERAKLAEVLPFVGVHVSLAEREGDRGKKLLDTLKDLIDHSDMVVLLIGSRAGSASETGQYWTKNEVDYAFAKGKRVLAYIREVPREMIALTDQNRQGEMAVRLLLEAVETKVALIPRYKRGECCKLTAMVIRDVARYVEELKAGKEKDSYSDSFTG
jgi:nucleoside 2-deoxyribosyltransferase